MSGRSARTAKNVLVSVGTQLVGWCMTFAVTLFLPRYVGSAGLGEIATAAAFVGVLGVIVPMGTSTVLTKWLARDGSRVAELMGTAFALRIPVALLAACVIVTMSRFVGYSSLARSLVVVYSVSLVLVNLGDVLSALLQGQEKIARQSTTGLIEKILATAFTIALIQMKASIIAIASVGLVTGTISFCMKLTAFTQFLPSVRFPKREQMTALARAGLPFMGWGMFQTLYGQTDPLVLRFISTNVTVGWYAASFRLIGTTLFFPSAVTSALMPTLARLYGDGAIEEYRALCRRLLSICLIMSVPVLVIFLCVPDKLIALLHYPESFNGSIPVLRIAGVGCFLYFIAIAVGAVVISSDGQMALLRASVVGAAIGIPLCIMASWFMEHIGISWLGGRNAAVGAMASDVILELVLISYYVRASPPNIFTYETILYGLRLFASAIPMAFVLLLPITKYVGLWMVIPGVALYIVFCFALRCMRVNDLYQIKRVLFSNGGTQHEP